MGQQHLRLRTALFLRALNVTISYQELGIEIIGDQTTGDMSEASSDVLRVLGFHVQRLVVGRRLDAQIIFFGTEGELTVQSELERLHLADGSTNIHLAVLENDGTFSSDAKALKRISISRYENSLGLRRLWYSS